jgi:hypothetical protein
MNTVQISYRLLADVILLLHVSFVIFAVLGALLVVRWRHVLWIHVAAVIWASTVEFFGWICPLTPLENWLRDSAGQDSYASDFIAHYVVPIVYPQGLTRAVQIGLGVFVVLINLMIYGWIFRYRTRIENS